METTKSYRYPGVRPFAESDSDVFFGRKEDINKLYKLIMIEKTVILFGKSGQGKSSILNAGILPKLKDKKMPHRFQYIPIEVRIGKVEGKQESPLQKVIVKLNELLPDIQESAFLEPFSQPDSLWYRFKRKQTVENSRFILIFDQFEEFFTYKEKDQFAFRWELAELLTTEIPQNIRENMENIDEKYQPFLSHRFDIKVIFAIRSDHLSSFHSVKDAIPGIFNSQYEIKGLRQDQAREAIEEPAKIEDARFATHPFSYDDPSLNIILKELSGMYHDGGETIEAFHLQIICQACETRIEDKLKTGEIDTEINIEDLPEFKNLYEQYYRRQMERLPAELKQRAQGILEHEFIYEDARTGERRRLSVDGNILRKKFADSGIQEDLLTMLENAFLIRREANSVGGFNYEIAHDTILDPILKERDKRLQQELMEKNYSRLLEIEKKKAVKKRRKLIAGGILFTLLVLFVVLKWEPISFRYLTAMNRIKDRPALKLNKKLNTTVKYMIDDLEKGATQIYHDKNLGAWEASQMVLAIGNNLTDSIKNNFYELTADKIDTSRCCCWNEMEEEKDLRATSWVSACIGILGFTQRYHCNSLEFLLDKQLNDGSWSRIPIDRKLTEYGSTYATCHAIRALYNNLPYIPDPIYKGRVERSIRAGAEWLLKNRQDTSGALWNDYPKDSSNQNLLLYKSLSGLAIHTLNTIKYATPDLNRKWLGNLRKSDVSVGITHHETSDKFYKFGKSEAAYRDFTRHLVIPWIMIATVDAYKDGTFNQRVVANIWFNAALDQLNQESIQKSEYYIKSEVLIALRYLQGRGYTFN